MVAHNLQNHLNRRSLLQTLDLVQHRAVYTILHCALILLLNFSFRSIKAKLSKVNFLFKLVLRFTFKLIEIINKVLSFSQLPSILNSQLSLSL